MCFISVYKTQLFEEIKIHIKFIFFLYFSQQINSHVIASSSIGCCCILLSNETKNNVIKKTHTNNNISGVTTMLNFFTTSNGFRSTLPVVSNLTAMNVWDGVCMCFIYASLLEFVCVNYVGRKRPLHNVVYRPGENPVTQVFYKCCIHYYLSSKYFLHLNIHIN